jgi:hypothetical protein
MRDGGNGRLMLNKNYDRLVMHQNSIYVRDEENGYLYNKHVKDEIEYRYFDYINDATHQYTAHLIKLQWITVNVEINRRE